MFHLNFTTCPLQHVPAVLQAFRDKNVSFLVRGGLQVLVMLADTNSGGFPLKLRGLLVLARTPELLHSRPLSILSWILLFQSTPGLCLISSCPVSLGPHGAAGGLGLWTVAVLFVISIMTAGSLILYKLKR